MSLRGLSLRPLLGAQLPIAPLVSLRVAFGLLMSVSLLRFQWNGWVDALYLQPSFHFPYYGFAWVQVPAPWVLHGLFVLLTLASACIALGLFYRAAAWLFAIGFTYVELLDVTYYLNHYYFVSLMAVLLALSPAGKAMALDVRFGLVRLRSTVTAAAWYAPRLQLALVYVFAGLAKLNADWLGEAQPLRLWLHARSDLPLVGHWLQVPGTAYLFAWCGMLFDLCIVFFLFRQRTAPYAYAVVVIFHGLTAILFPGIGMFPYMMIALTTVFLPTAWHQALWRIPNALELRNTSYPALRTAVFSLWLGAQVLLPLRQHLYRGNIAVTEYGHRFAWRVMVWEKAATVFFTLEDRSSGRRYAVNNSAYLSAQQEKQMATQPDMILRFAHHLAAANAGWLPDAAVYAEAYLSINGRPSRLYTDPTADLTRYRDGLGPQPWVHAQ